MIPEEMARLVSNFNTDSKERETNKGLDPFYLAAGICQDFVMIHPLGMETVACVASLPTHFSSSTVEGQKASIVLPDCTGYRTP